MFLPVCDPSHPQAHQQEVCHLQQLLPSPSSTICEARLLQDTVAYIHHLELELLARVTGGQAPPPALAKVLSGGQGVRSLKELQGVLHRALGPAMEARLEERARRDRRAMQALRERAGRRHL